MVCTLGRGRMAAMVRLLGDGSYSEMRAEEVGHKKLAAQSIHGELCNVDEANLLDEEDMHVFDCEPMVDPLHLVCCNNCRKPIKGSQYAAHSERCRLLNSMEEFFLEVDGIGGNGHKKPPRKGRKKSQTVQERNSSRIGGVSVKDVSVACPGNANHPLVGLSSSEKRTKLIAAEHLLMPEGLEAVHGVTRNNGLNYVKVSTSPPLPLATKMYHSQRNHRLRCALKHLYHEASTKEHTSDPMSPKLVQENVMLSSQVSLPKDLLHDSQSDEFLQKKQDTCSLVTVREHDQILAQSSDLCLGNLRGYPSAVDFAGKFRDNSFPRPAPSVETATMGKMRSRYLSTTYSYPGNSGTPLGTMQQQNGSVHVV